MTFKRGEGHDRRAMHFLTADNNETRKSETAPSTEGIQP